MGAHETKEGMTQMTDKIQNTSPTAYGKMSFVVLAVTIVLSLFSICILYGIGDDILFHLNRLGKSRNEGKNNNVEGTGLIFTQVVGRNYDLSYKFTHKPPFSFLF